jgi:hydrogenase maturation protease
MKVLVAAFGNPLWGDDGFGIRVLQKLTSEPLPDGVKLLEAGIGGISVLQELLSGYDALILLDAMDKGLPPGTVQVLALEVPKANLNPNERLDMHLADPQRVVAAAKALGVLPPQVFLVGCQIGRCEWGQEVSPKVAVAIEVAAQKVHHLLAQLLQPAAPKGGDDDGTDPPMGRFCGR